VASFAHNASDAIAAMSMGIPQAVLVNLGKPDNATHLLEVVVDSNRKLDPEVDDLGFPFRAVNNRANVTVSAFTTFEFSTRFSSYTPL